MEPGPCEVAAPREVTTGDADLQRSRTSPPCHDATDEWPERSSVSHLHAQGSLTYDGEMVKDDVTLDGIDMSDPT